MPLPEKQRVEAVERFRYRLEAYATIAKLTGWVKN